MKFSIKHIAYLFAAKLTAAILVCVLSVSFATQFHYHDHTGAVHACIHFYGNDHSHDCTSSTDGNHSHNEHDNCSLRIVSWFVDEANSSHHHCSAHHHASCCQDCAIISSEIVVPECYCVDSEAIIGFELVYCSQNSASHSQLRAPPAIG